MTNTTAYETKLQGLFQAKHVLTHETYPENIIPILRHGLMPYAIATESGMPVKLGAFYGNEQSAEPDLISLFLRENTTPTGKTNVSGPIPMLLIDPKYHNPDCYLNEHPAYDDAIKAEDILAVIVSEIKLQPSCNHSTEIEGCHWLLDTTDELMEGQRVLPDEYLTPMFAVSNTGVTGIGISPHSTRLYIPNWLEVSAVNKRKWKHITR